jgi:hypothetical protein
MTHRLMKRLIWGVWICNGRGCLVVGGTEGIGCGDGSVRSRSRSQWSGGGIGGKGARSARRGSGDNFFRHTWFASASTATGAVAAATAAKKPTRGAPFMGLLEGIVQPGEGPLSPPAAARAPEQGGKGPAEMWIGGGSEIWMGFEKRKTRKSWRRYYREPTTRESVVGLIASLWRKTWFFF